MDTADEPRPDPDALLAAVQREELRRSRGRLKVFLGMAAGAGKTYAMLEAARRLQAEGRDVVIGYVETHGRRETEELARDLPVVFRRAVEHRGVALTEMDLDAVLARRPEIALVDELAHTNAPGSRHPKRYQDVIELLDAGITVYTTLNVQHVDSRADTVRQVTGVAVTETVPDSVLDQAEIELVDVAPDELLQRLTDGKVYLPERASVALQNFFSVGNLTALRELALRLAADHVGQDVRDYMQARLISGPWKTGHRLLVAVSHSPLSDLMVRWTRRLADSLECSWIALHVESSRTLSTEDEAQLTRNLTLARTLGAQVHVSADEDVVRGILRVARAQNVTQIVVGKPAGRHPMRFLRAAWLLQRLMRASGDIDVHVVRVGGDGSGSARPWRTPGSGHIDWRGYGLVCAVIALVTALNLMLDGFVGYRSVALIYLTAVVGTAMALGRGPVILGAALSAMLWNYLFLPPRYTLLVHSLDDAMMFLMYFVVAVAMGQLIARLRAKEKMDRRREMKASAMYLLTLELADASTLDEIVRTAVTNVDRVFHGQSALLLPEGEPGAEFLVVAVPGINTLAMSEKEISVATWALQTGNATGRFTDTLPLAEGMYVPLTSTGGTLGVLGVRLEQGTPPGIEQRGLLEAFARHIALVLDRYRLREGSARARILAESERLTQTFLSSISHELRTPLAAISGAAGELARRPPEVQEALAAEISTAAERLNRLVENLLDMTRLESGHVRARPDWLDVRDVVGAVLQNLAKEAAGRRVTVSIAEDVPLLRADDALLEQALANLVLNATVHTEPGTPIEIRAVVDGADIAISVADRGPGLAPEALPRAFSKFYRGPDARPGGSGLGLSIVKGFVESQGGRVSAANRDGGGAVFTIRLPREEPPAITEQRA